MPLDTEKVFGNILSLASSEVAARVVAFVATTYLARKLGPSEFGVVGFATALTSYLTLAVASGFYDVGSREVARRPDQASAIAISATIVRLALAVVALAVTALVVLFLHKPPTVKAVIILMTLSFFSLAVDTSWVYKGLERNRPVALALLLGQILYAGTVLIAVKSPKDVILVPLAQFFGEMSAALLLAVPLFRSGERKVVLSEGLRILRSSTFPTVSKLFRTLIFTFDVVLIGFMLGERDVGLYNAPYRICYLLAAISMTIHSTYLPALTRALGQGPAQAGSVAERSLEFSAAVAAPMIAGGIILAGPVLTAVFGSQYIEGAGAFQWLLLSIGLMFVSQGMRNVLLVCNYLKLDLAIMGAATALNVGLNFIVIPRYGLAGAAFATAAAEALIVVCGLIAVHRIGIPLRLRPVLRPLLAAAAMGACLMALGTGRYVAIYIAFGFVIYMAVLILSGGVPQDARAHFRRFA